MTVPELNSIVLVVRSREEQGCAVPRDGYDSDVESGLDEVYMQNICVDKLALIYFSVGQITSCQFLSKLCM